MGVMVSKSRVFQTCLDIDYVSTDAHHKRNKVMVASTPTPNTTPVRNHVAVRPESAVHQVCRECWLERGESVLSVEDSVEVYDLEDEQSPEHVHTVDGWKADGDIRPECTVCSVHLTAVYASQVREGELIGEDSLIVQIHATASDDSEDDDELPAGKEVTFHHQPNKGLFEQPFWCRLESPRSPPRCSRGLVLDFYYQRYTDKEVN